MLNGTEYLSLSLSQFLIFELVFSLCAFGWPSLALASFTGIKCEWGSESEKRGKRGEWKGTKGKRASEREREFNPLVQ